MKPTPIELERALQSARQNNDQRAEAGALNELGAFHTRPGGGHDGLRFLEQALQIAQHLNDRALQAQIEVNMGRAFMADGLVRNALASYTTGRSHAQQSGAHATELLALRSLTYANRQFISADKALDYAKQAAALAETIEETQTQGEMLLVAANLLGDMDFFEEATAAYRQALSVFEETGQRHEQAQALGNLALTAARQHDAEQASAWFEQAQALFEELGKTADMVQADTYQDAIRAGAIEQFIPAPLLTLRKAREAGFAEHILNALDDVMAYHVEQSHMRSVIMYAHQKIAVARQIADDQSEGDAFADLGTAHLALGEAEEAAEAQQQALKIAQARGDQQSQLYALLGLFDAMQQIDKQQAVEIGLQADAIAQSLTDTETQMQVAGVLGVLYEDIAHVDKAARHLRRAADFAERLGETSKRATYLFNLGMLLHEQNQSGTEELQMARDVFLELNQPDIVERIDRVLKARP